MVRRKPTDPVRLNGKEMKARTWTEDLTHPVHSSDPAASSIIDDSTLELDESQQAESRAVPGTSLSVGSPPGDSHSSTIMDSSEEAQRIQIVCGVETLDRDSKESWNRIRGSANNGPYIRGGMSSETLKVKIPQFLSQTEWKSLAGTFASIPLEHEARFLNGVLSHYILGCENTHFSLLVRQDGRSWMSFGAGKDARRQLHWVSCSFPLPYSCVEAVKKVPGGFSYLLCEREETESELRILVKMRESLLKTNPLHHYPTKPAREGLEVVMEQLYGKPGRGWASTGMGYRENVADLYKSLKEHRKKKKEGPQSQHLSLQHPGLIPRLRHYQEDALRFMLSREREDIISRTKTLRDGFEEFTLMDGQRMYYHKEGGILMRDIPEESSKSPPGGILADEMGLGKTVEMLALILHNPMPSEGRNTPTPPPQSPQEAQKEQDPAKIAGDVLEEVVSTVCAQLEHIYAIQQSPKKQTRSEAFKKKERELRTLKRKLRLVDGDYISPPHKMKRSSPTGALECFCGWQDDPIHSEVDDMPRAQCGVCGNWQHKECVNWKWDDTLDYLCPHCTLKKEEPRPIGATLIVSPSSICHQWYEEIRKHIRKCSIKVFIYEGVKKQGFIQPRTMGEQDIVICTYETFRSEVFYLNLKHNDRLRYAKRFTTPPSPLTSVLWWRVCLDEAQMVENVSTQAADLCLSLAAVNRWCVTGTPIQKSLQDLYGLILYLGQAPLWVKYWWDTLVYLPYVNEDWGRMLDLVNSIMWRTEKADVLEQLGIPEQEQRVEWLDFSPVEEHFYRRVQTECGAKMAEGLASSHLHSPAAKGKKLSHLDRHTLDKLMRPLLQLRRACCHPQVTQGGKIIHIRQKMMTMEDVLKKMIKDTAREAAEEHRALVAAHNGLAGVHWLWGEWARAGSEYRTVLLSCADLSENVKADKLQQIHALHNLADLISLHRPDIPPTLRDDTLREECGSLSEKYLDETTVEMGLAREEMEEVVKKTKEALLEVEVGKAWFVGIGKESQKKDLSLDLVAKVKETLEIAARGMGAARMEGSFSNVQGLGYVLDANLKKLGRAREELETGMSVLVQQGLEDPEFGSDAALCHLRPLGGVDLETCPVCEVHKLFDAYEERLFNFDPEQNRPGTTVVAQEEEDVKFYGKLRKGTWEDSPLQQALKAVYQFAKARERFFDPQCLDWGKRHLDLFELFKKEFRAWRALWIAIRDHVSQRDELSMATERLRFFTKEEKMGLKREGDNLGAPINAIHEIQLPETQLKLKQDVAVGRIQLEKKLGHLSYLKTLERMEGGEGEGGRRGNEEECPICKSPLGHSWALLLCGHCYCCDCLHILATRCGGEHMRCPVCRESSHKSHVSYVSARYERERESGGLEVRGSHSTKVEAVVRCLMAIRKKEPGAKCLVFSSWQEVLQIVGKALDENGIPQLFLRSNSQAGTVGKFRTSQDFNILLLPVQSGANGLNLVEATHVILVEPLLNLAAEQQAIGRVHRIGQRRKTTVHRFLVRGTMEERIYTLMGEHSSKEPLLNDQQETSITVGELAELFK